MKRSSCVIVVAVVFASAPAPTSAQMKPELTGRWMLNRQASEFPPEIGFAVNFVPTTEDERTGRGGRGSGDSASLFRRESQDDSQRARQLTAEARSPSAYLTIAVAADAVTITDDRERARTLHTAGRDDVLQLDQVAVSANARWEAGRLVVLYKVAEGRDIRYTYTLGPAQLVVQVQFVERGGHESARRVYDRVSLEAPWPPPSVKPATPPPQPGAAATGAIPAQPPQPPDAPSVPAFDQSPDAELKGLTKLGIVVEGLGAQAKACGLQQDAIETAVSKRLTDAGFTVRRNADEDTYLYVNVMTSTVSNGACVSHYDAFLYTHTTATLSYQTRPVLVQVSLLHKAGMAGGAPALHAESVLRDLTQYVDQFAARIKAAGR